MSFIVINGVGWERKSIQEALRILCHAFRVVIKRWRWRRAPQKGEHLNKSRERRATEKFLLHTWDVKTDGWPVIRAIVRFLSCLERPEVRIVLFGGGGIRRSRFSTVMQAVRVRNLAVWVIACMIGREPQISPQTHMTVSLLDSRPIRNRVILLSSS